MEPRALRRRPFCPRVDVSTSLACCLLPAGTWGRHRTATLQTSAVRWCSAWASIQVLPAGLYAAMTLCYWVPVQALVRPSRYSGPLAHELAHPFSLAFARCMAAFVYQFAATCWLCTSTQRLPSRSRPSGDFQVGRPGERAAWVGAGHAGPGRGGTGAGRQGIAAGERPGQSTSSPTFTPCWRTFLPTWATRRRPAGTGRAQHPGGAAGGTLEEAEIIASGASCSYGRWGRRSRRRKPGCSGPWTSPAARRRNR